MMQTKDILLAPIYLYQGRKLNKTALRLPEAEGNRHGLLTLTKEKSVVSRLSDSPTLNRQTLSSQILESETLDRQTLNLMIVGDSAAAGVGVDLQEEAITGHLLKNLSTSTQLKTKYDHIKWSLHATSGHTSSDLLYRLYILPIPVNPVDIMVVIIGANDTTSNVALEQWQKQIEEIIAIGKRKFKAQNIIFSCLPPMGHFPSISFPLNKYIGAISDLLDCKLKEVCQAHTHVTYLDIDFAKAGLEAKNMFAKDGFHPNAITYEYWALELAQTLLKLL